MWEKFRPIAEYRANNVMKVWREKHLTINLKSEYDFYKRDTLNWEKGNKVFCEDGHEYRAKKLAVDETDKCVLSGGKFLVSVY